MGLRKLLGLPKKKSDRTATQTATPPDRTKYDAAMQKHDRLIAMSDFALMDKEDRDTLERQRTLAVVEASLNDFDEGAATLTGALALAAQALVRTKMNLARLKEVNGIVSGNLDGARLSGVTAAELSAHVAQLKSVSDDENLSSGQKVQLMEALLKAVETDPNILAAKAAQGRYLSEHAAIEAAATKALEVAPLPPIVNRLKPQLEQALPRIGGAAGKLDFRTAVKEMDCAAGLVKKIEAERARIAQAVVDKAAAEQARSTLDAKVKKARTVVGFGPEEEAVVNLFAKLDQKFYGAMQAGQYRVALQTIKQLATSVERVLLMEPRSKERLVAVTAAGEVFSKALALYKSCTLPDPTPNFIASADMLAGRAWGEYFDAVENDDYEAAKIHAENFLAKSKVRKGLIADAAGLQVKYDEADNLWSNVEPRYNKIAAATYVSDELKALQSEIVEAENTRAGIDRTDIPAYLDAVKALEAVADKVDAKSGDEAACVQRKADQRAAFDKVAGKAATLAGFAAKGPTLTDAIKAVAVAFEELKALYDKGEPLVETKIEALNALIKTAEEAKAGDGAETETAKKLADEKWEFDKPKRQEAWTQANAHASIKEVSNLLKQRLDLIKKVAAARKSEEWARSMRLMEELEAVCTNLLRDIETLKLQDAEREREFKRRRATIKDDLATIMGYDEALGKKYADAKLVVTRAEQRIVFPESTRDWSWALTDLPGLEAAVAEGIKLKTDHAKAKSDHDSVGDVKARVGGDVDTLIARKASSVESEDIIRRATNGKKIGDKAFAEKDFALAKTYWDRAEAALADWNGGGKVAADAAKLEMDRLELRWKNLANRREAQNVPASIPEAKEPVARFERADSRFRAAFFAFDSVTADLALDDLELAIPDVMAIKAAADSKQLEHEATRDAAETTLKSRSLDQLKAMPQAERRDLLAQLHSAGSNNLTDEQKKQRAKLYDAMMVDPEFDKADKKRRKELVDELKADEEVKEARGKWGQMDLDAKLALLQKVMEKECRIFDIPVPTMRTFNQKPGDEGFFAADKYTMNVNLHPMSGFSDFKEAVDTVVHETAHAYQFTLLTRIEDGLVGPEAPEYEEGKLFAQNFDGYVTPDDAKAAGNNTYNTQPIERHAWDTGGGVATDLISLPVDVKPGDKL